MTMTDYNTHEDHTPRNGDVLAGWIVFAALLGLIALV